MEASRARGGDQEGIPLSNMATTTSTNAIDGGAHVQDKEGIIASIPTITPLTLFSLAFFLLGLLNNSLYVVILTSALELIPQGTPTGLVALANIGPALIAKAVWPYVLKGQVRYARRVWACTLLSTVGMLIIAIVPALGARLVGISMASFSSGLGELTWLQLCTRYGPVRAGRGVGWFASGTGAAGLFGAGAWWIVRPLGVRTGLTIMSVLPLFMAASYFLMLPSVEQLKEFEAHTVFAARGGGYQAVPSDEDDEVERAEDEEATQQDGDRDDDLQEGVHRASESGSGLRPVHPEPTSSSVMLLPRELDESIPDSDKHAVKLSLDEKLALLKPMLVPFILPLVLVYLFEYTINQGVAPTLLYPVPKASQHRLLSWMIKSLHDYYPLYQLTYQAFVFLSRSSLSLLHIPPIPRSLLWIPAIVQAAILVLLTSESLYAWFRESIARSLCIVFVGIEGLAGGWA